MPQVRLLKDRKLVSQMAPHSEAALPQTPVAPSSQNSTPYHPATVALMPKALIGPEAGRPNSQNPSARLCVLPFGTGVAAPSSRRKSLAFRQLGFGPARVRRSGMGLVWASLGLGFRASDNWP